MERLDPYVTKGCSDELRRDGQHGEAKDEQEQAADRHERTGDQPQSRANPRARASRRAHQRRPFIGGRVITSRAFGGDRVDRTDPQPKSTGPGASFSEWRRGRIPRFALSQRDAIVPARSDADRPTSSNMGASDGPGCHAFFIAGGLHNTPRTRFTARLLGPAGAGRSLWGLTIMLRSGP